MDFKLNKEEICTSETIFNAKQEQAIELDYVLPDYFPEIYKIIKCIAEPRITSREYSGKRLSYDITVCLRILYCSENSKSIHVIEQRLVYTKTTELENTAVNPDLKVTASVDYINCRAVNSRRIDLRGAISAEVTINDICTHKIVSNASGMGIQLCKIPVTYPVNRLYTSKQIMLNEDFELGDVKPSISNVICADASIISTDKKVIANKMVAKGEINVNLLYNYNVNDECGIESMQFTVPFSQIIDIEGIDERFECYVEAEIISSDAQPSSDGSGSSNSVNCQICVLIKCYAFRTSTVEFVSDQYSTEFDSTDNRININIETIPEYINTTSVIKTAVNFENEIPETIYGVRTYIKKYSAVNDDNHIIFNGTAVYTIISCNEEKMPVISEKEDSFTVKIPYNCLTDSVNINLNPSIISCSYTIVSDNNIEITSEIKISGAVSCNETINGIDNIIIDEEKKVDKCDDCALKLYFAEDGESIWDISKRYRSPVSMVMEENNIDEDYLSKNSMLIIPIL